MTKPNFRDLCAELLDEFDYYTDWSDAEEVKDRARAALAQPEPVAPKPVAPTDEELLRLAREWNSGHESIEFEFIDDYARAVLAKWGTPANNTREEN